MPTVVLDDSDWAERSRLRCPEGHGWWEAYASSWYCRSFDQSYEALLDTKTDCQVAPEDVLLKSGHRKR